MKQKIKKLVHQLWTDESGQGTAEYALIIVGIVGLAFLFRDKIQSILGTFMDNNVKDAIDGMGQGYTGTP